MSFAIVGGLPNSHPLRIAFGLAHLVIKYASLDNSATVPLMKNHAMRKKIMRWENHLLDSYLGDGSNVYGMPPEVPRAKMDKDGELSQGCRLAEKPMMAFLLQRDRLSHPGLPPAPEGECPKVDA